jgi:membrane carboxypeptidase/penicillin-binding protein PbpC
VLNDLRGDVAEARKDHRAAEQYWRSYIVARPDAADGLEKLADLCSFGNRRLGPEAAARAYFGKPARNFTLAEAVFLAGIPQAPTRLNPWRYPDLNSFLVMPGWG